MLLDYAILESGNKQYRVAPGDVIDVDRLPDEEGASIELSNILAISKDGELYVGTPTVSNSSIIAEVRAQDKDKKIVVFKYKRKTRYRKKQGHRQPYTRLVITSVLFNGEELTAPTTKNTTSVVTPQPIQEETSSPAKPRRQRKTTPKSKDNTDGT
mgnify:FL=1